VSGASGLSVNVVGANFRQLIKPVPRPVKGMSDWRRLEEVVDVPEEAQSIFPGIILQGKGKMWVDDVKMEVVKEP